MQRSDQLGEKNYAAEPQVSALDPWAEYTATEGEPKLEDGPPRTLFCSLFPMLRPLIIKLMTCRRRLFGGASIRIEGSDQHSSRSL
jgi:hypothetical protein